MKKTVSLFLIACAILSIFSVYVTGTDNNQNTQNIVFSVNDPRYVINDEIFYHDDTNSGVTPIIYNSRMLIPLRSVATAFGASVDYDAQNSQAVIKINNKTILFPIGQSYMYVDSQKIDIDTQSIIKENRTMVPVRALCENALDLKVDFKDRYCIISKQLDTKASDNAIAKLSNLKYYATYEEIKSLIQTNAASDETDKIRTAYGMGGMENSTQKSTAAMDTADTASSGSKTSSQTNVQVEGVDEADIIKTDGQYIYYMSSGTINIVKALSDNKLELVSTIKRDDEKTWFSDMYIENNRLVVCATQSIFTIMPVDTGFSGMEKSLIMPPSKHYTDVFVYDITDRQNPSLIKTLELEGSSLATRKIGNLVYLVTQKYIHNTTKYPDNYFPTYKDSAKGDQIQTIEPNKIAIMPNPIKSSYLNIAVINISDDSASNVQSLLGSGHTIYMNKDALYTATNVYDDNKSYTDITRFELVGQSVVPKTKARIEGYINDQFSMDEYEGYFRVVSSNWDEQGNVNSLYIFDTKTMKQTGSIQSIAPGESIYSVRFDKNTGYIVTFKQVDPLFKIDLRDPKNPKITGQLKIPGYSSYLHPVGENLVLGVGRDVKDTYMRDDNGKEVVVGTIDDGLKLTLFDVSSDTPVEVDTLKLSDSRNIYTDAQNNHKAFMFDKDKNIAGFCVSDYNSSSKSGPQNYGVIIKINDKNMILDAKLKAETNLDYSYYGQNRLCYINDVIYYVNDGIIYAYNYNNYSLITRLSLLK